MKVRHSLRLTVRGLLERAEHIIWSISGADLSMRELAQRDGLFGPIRVLERKSDGARLYCIGSSIQTMMLREGVSTFGYVHAAKLLLADAKSVLIVGGAGVLLTFDPPLFAGDRFTLSNQSDFTAFL